MQTFEEWVKPRMFNVARRTGLAKEAYNAGVAAGRADERELGPCGLHPKACWVDSKDLPHYGAAMSAPFCAACAELSKLRAELADARIRADQCEARATELWNASQEKADLPKEVETGEQSQSKIAQSDVKHYILQCRKLQLELDKLRAEADYPLTPTGSKLLEQVQAEHDALREGIREKVKDFNESTVGIGNYGSMRPLTEVERNIARACADELAALLSTEGKP